MQLPVHPNPSSPDLFIHIALLRMQNAAYVIACYSSVDCPCSSADALESCLTFSHAIPVLLLHLSHPTQHLLVLCTTLSLRPSPQHHFLQFSMSLPQNADLSHSSQFCPATPTSQMQFWTCTAALLSKLGFATWGNTHIKGRQTSPSSF